MIPKKIHYCWFGDSKLPPKIAYCIESWKKNLPDYEIIQWNQEKFPPETTAWTKEAYESRKFAFVADYIRFYALQTEGGIYLDADVEVLKPFDPLLDRPYFLGREQSPNIVESAIFGVAPNSKWVGECLEHYKDRHFIKEDGSFDMVPLPELMRDLFMERYGISMINRIEDFNPDEKSMQLLPVDFFSPKHHKTLKLKVTDNTFTIHHFAGSWVRKKSRYRRTINWFKRMKKSDFVVSLQKKFHQIYTFPIRKLKWLIFNMTAVQENYILLESEGDFCDNARAFYEHLVRNHYNDDYVIVWNVKDLDYFRKREWPKNVLLTSTNAGLKEELRAWKIYGKCKYFFFTHPYWLKNRKKNQISINMCHGMPLKAAGANKSNTYDYLLAQSRDFKDWILKFHHASEGQLKFFEPPRNDLMFETNDAVEKLFGESHRGNKLLLCMNTFRQGALWEDCSITQPFVLPTISSTLEMKQLNEILAKLKIYLVIKIHHLQRTEILQQMDFSNIRYLEDTELVEKDVQLHHLVGAADGLLTDYSSIYFDYLLLNRPIGFFLSDFESYAKERGFIVENPQDYMPGEKIFTHEDFLRFLDDFSRGIDRFEQERLKMKPLFNITTDANSSQRVAEHFLKRLH